MYYKFFGFLTLPFIHVCTRIDPYFYKEICCYVLGGLIGISFGIGLKL